MGLQEEPQAGRGPDQVRPTMESKLPGGGRRDDVRAVADDGPLSEFRELRRVCVF